jgi:hypothetical protein
MNIHCLTRKTIQFAFTRCLPRDTTLSQLTPALRKPFYRLTLRFTNSVCNLNHNVNIVQTPCPTDNADKGIQLPLSNTRSKPRSRTSRPASSKTPHTSPRRPIANRQAPSARIHGSDRQSPQRPPEQPTLLGSLSQYSPRRAPLAPGPRRKQGLGRKAKRGARAGCRLHRQLVIPPNRPDRRPTPRSVESCHYIPRVRLSSASALKTSKRRPPDLPPSYLPSSRESFVARHRISPHHPVGR